MRQKIKFINDNILLIDIGLLVLYLISSFVLNLINIKFRLFVSLDILGFIFIIFIYGIAKFMIKSPWFIKISILVIILCIFIIIFMFLGLFIFIAVVSYKPEHTVELDGKKYVAEVSSFLNVNVAYYDYYGPFFKGTKERVHGNFGKGGYDPFVNHHLPSYVTYTYYDENGKVKSTKSVTLIKDKDDNVVDKQEIITYDREWTKFNPNDDYLLVEDEEVLYEKEINNKIYRFGKVDNILGGRMLINVIVSKDKGKSFERVCDDVVQVSNEAKFEIIDENNMFIASTGKINLNDGTGLYVSIDGGKSFSYADINYNNNNVEDISIVKMPYLKDNQLLLECSVYIFNPSIDGYEDKPLIYISKDNGLTWKLET